MKPVNEELCVGYMSTRTAAGVDYVAETLWALLSDGRVLVTGPHRFDPAHFDKPGRVWTLCSADPDTIHEGREFIGNYPVPKIIK